MAVEFLTIAVYIFALSSINMSDAQLSTGPMEDNGITKTRLISTNLCTCITEIRNTQFIYTLKNISSCILEQLSKCILKYFSKSISLLDIPEVTREYQCGTFVFGPQRLASLKRSIIIQGLKRYLIKTFFYHYNFQWDYSKTWCIGKLI